MRRLVLLLLMNGLLVVGCGSPATAEPTATSTTLPPTTTPTMVPPMPTPTPMPVTVSAGDMAALLDTSLPHFDPVDWGRRTGEISGPLPTPETTTYVVGDIQTFWVWTPGDSNERKVEARLAYMNDVVAMWVQTGEQVRYSELVQAADTFATSIYPRLREVFGEESSPGIDGDPRLTILHVGEIRGFGGYFGPYDQYPRSVYETSNERDMFYISLASAKVGSEYYMATLAHEFQHMIQHAVDPTEMSWLNEGLSQVAERIAGYDNTVVNHSAFLADTRMQLNDWTDGSASLPLERHYGASYLFLLYIYEQYGEEAIQAIAHHPDQGMRSVDAVLKEYETTASDVFEDWVVANFVNTASLDDGQYGYTTETLRPVCPRQQVIVFPARLANRLPQYAAEYLELGTSGDLDIQFQGDVETPLIPDAAHSGESFFWSNRGDNLDTTLTRAFDLTGLDEATLQFSTWYETEYSDIVYVMVSEDGGDTWDFVTDGEYSGPDRIAGTEWANKELNLSDYAGKDILLRFEYVTDISYSDLGFALDDVTIPELEYAEDFEQGDGGWEADGFIRTSNIVPQRWAVSVMVLTPDGYRVEQVPVAADGSAHATLQVGPDEVATLVVAAMAPSTRVPAHYTLNIGGETTAEGSFSNLLFHDDFENPCRGWDAYSTVEFDAGYTDGQFYIDIRDPDYLGWALANDTFKDGIIDVDIAWDDTNEGRYGGVWCHYYDDDHNVQFLIDTNGYYAMLIANGGSPEYARYWTWTSAIQTGAGAINHLTATCTQDGYQLNINGQQVLDYNDASYLFRQGRFGLVSAAFDQSGVRVLFDNLTVVKP